MKKAAEELLADEILKESPKIKDKIAQQVKAVREDYAYLNDTPFEGWIWEFIRRSPAYTALYNEIENAFRTIDIVKGNTDLNDIHDNILISPIQAKLSKLLEFNIPVSLLGGKPHDADNFMNIDSLDFVILIPNPKTKSNQFCCHGPNIG